MTLVRQAVPYAAPPAPSGWSIAFNLRSSESYGGAGEQADEVWCGTTTYPFVFDNGTVATDAGNVATPFALDRVATADRRLRGDIYSSGLVHRFRVDVPNPGQYRIVTACGDAGASGINWDMSMQILDQDLNQLYTSPSFVVASPNFAGTDGVVKSQAAWVADADSNPPAVSETVTIPAPTVDPTPAVIVQLTPNITFCGMCHLRVTEI